MPEPNDRVVENGFSVDKCFHSCSEFPLNIKNVQKLPVKK